MSSRTSRRNRRLARLGVVFTAGLWLAHAPVVQAQSGAALPAPTAAGRSAPSGPAPATPAGTATSPAARPQVPTAAPVIATPNTTPNTTPDPVKAVPPVADPQTPPVTDVEPPPAGFVPGAPSPDSSQGQDACLSDSHCNELYERARSLSRVGQYEASLIMYQQTYALKPLPWLLLNIGRVQQKLGRNDQAAISFRRLLDFNAKLPTDETTGLADPEVLAKARQYLTEAEQSILEKQAAIPIVPVSPRELVPARVPVYQRWWFWAAVSGGLGLTALGIGLGFGLSANTSAPRVPGGVDILYPAF